ERASDLLQDRPDVWTARAAGGRRRRGWIEVGDERRDGAACHIEDELDADLGWAVTAIRQLIDQSLAFLEDLDLERVVGIAAADPSIPFSERVHQDRPDSIVDDGDDSVLRAHGSLLHVRSNAR